MNGKERCGANLAHLCVPGKTLEGNPLGDPARRMMPVYLPPSYDGKKRFPVIYLLAGFASSGPSFTNYSFMTPSVPEMADRLMRDGEMKETIIVMPDCMTRYGGSQYVDSAATGRYETYLAEEVVEWVDANLATLPEGRHRAVAGKSSGGFGALRLAMRRPGTFGAAACHSGDMAFELSYRPNFAVAARILERYEGSIPAFYERYFNSPKPLSGEFPLLDILAMSAAYSPDPSNDPPENMRLPFNRRTAEIDEEVWQEWLRFDPVRMVEEEANREALRALSLLFLDCGTMDEYNLQFGLRILSRELGRHGVAHRHMEFMDTHGGTSYRYRVSLPALALAIHG
ncbi:alpha/beta hydrolase-fold protein [Chlorobium sp. N1]|uniref:alpha/beta hydrolase n=1 Tax=Chlorobium sp. N1 TaxID=2491138 RepID=UPI001038C59A|nr:alpha/beta hydrolase-fold protein [Chlorobium sp. N1]TCD48418.1 esterase [Chlorobium sp. N1]